MFERYTEKARRVIFFGRYEACLYGSPEIDTEHLLLATGEVMVAGATVQLYTSAGQASRSWAPMIAAFPASVLRGSRYAISGTQFNGLSQAVPRCGIWR